AVGGWPRVSGGGLRRRHGLDGAHVDFRRRLRSGARQQCQNDGEPKCHSQEKSHASLSSGLMFGLLRSMLSATVKMLVCSAQCFLSVFGANQQWFFTNFEPS